MFKLDTNTNMLQMQNRLSELKTDFKKGITEN